MAVATRFRILGARKAANLTQEELSRRVGCAMMSVSRWETRDTPPGPEHLRKLADALDVDRAWLAWGDGKPSADKAESARVIAWVKKMHAERKREAA